MTMKYINAISMIGLMMAGFAAAPVSANDENDMDDIIESCTRTIYEYAMARDALDPDRYAGTFTEDGEMRLHGKTYKGRDTLARRIRESGNKTFDRHLMTSISIKPVNDTTATGTTYFMVFQAPGSARNALPVSSNYDILIGEYIDTFKINNEDCKIAKREAKIAFTVKQ